MLLTFFVRNISKSRRVFGITERSSMKTKILCKLKNILCVNGNSYCQCVYSSYKWTISWKDLSKTFDKTCETLRKLEFCILIWVWHSLTFLQSPISYILASAILISNLDSPYLNCIRKDEISRVNQYISGLQRWE